MAAPHTADHLRALADSLEPGLGSQADDSDVLTLKRILLVKAANLESESASNKIDDASPKD